MNRLAVSLVACHVLASSSTAQVVTVDFEDVTLNLQNYNPGTSSPYNGQSYINGGTLQPVTTFTSRGATFNANYYAPYNLSSAWFASNVYNPTTAGFTNQYAAYNVGRPTAGIGHNGVADSSNYGIVNNNYAGEAYVNLPAGYRPGTIQITNTTYAALSMKFGDSFAKKFGGASGDDPDYFKLTIIGKNGNTTTGSVDFYLADYRSDHNMLDYIVDHWTTVDLSSLPANTTRLEFDLSSSDVGQYGINTPLYFAVDNLVLSPVPEPGSLIAVATIGGLLLHMKRRLRREALVAE